MKITKEIQNHDSINHFELRSDIESGYLVGERLIDEGKISSYPECWAITTTDDTMYQYDYKTEYEEDKKILSDYFVSPEGEKVFVLVEKSEVENWNIVDGWFDRKVMEQSEADSANLEMDKIESNKLIWILLPNN